MGSACLLALALAGCGGSDGSTGSPTAQADRMSAHASAEVEQLQERAREIRQRRERQGAARQAKGKAAEPTPGPVAHHDSGGGAAQFRRHGGDNSIQESGVEAAAAERERAATAFHAYLDLRAAHRWAAACEYMAASLIVSLERAVALSQRSTRPEGCPAVLAAMSKAAPQGLLEELTEADVGSLRISGGKGFLLYHGPRGEDYVMTIVKEAGTWTMAAMDGTILP